MVGPTWKCLPCITAQRHFNDYSDSNATRRAAHSVLGPANPCFVRGKAQKHNGTNAQGFDFIVGRMHGWAYFAILRVFLKKVTKLFWGFWPKIARKTQKRIGCHPIPFRVFLWPKRAGKTAKRTGMTRLGSQACHPSPFRGFLAEKGRENPKTDWDDKPGEPRCVILEKGA